MKITGPAQQAVIGFGILQPEKHISGEEMLEQEFLSQDYVSNLASEWRTEIQVHKAELRDSPLLQL